MKITSYLHFQGNCRDAMVAYARLFNATDLNLIKYADMPEGPDAFHHSDLIMHSQFSIEGGASLMASDFPPGVDGDAQKAASVMITPKTVAKARELFEALAQNGAVIDDFKANFVSPGFGMVKDRFGTHWIIAAEGA
ncbi:MAG: VOC family protein [Deltaproteobacteria bacterium]